MNGAQFAVDACCVRTTAGFPSALGVGRSSQSCRPTAIRCQNHKLQNPDLHWIWLFGALSRRCHRCACMRPQSLDRSISVRTFATTQPIEPGDREEAPLAPTRQRPQSASPRRLNQVLTIVMRQPQAEQPSMLAHLDKVRSALTTGTPANGTAPISGSPLTRRWR